MKKVLFAIIAIVLMTSSILLVACDFNKDDGNENGNDNGNNVEAHGLTHITADDLRVCVKADEDFECWYCEICDKYFSDSNEKNELSEAKKLLLQHQGEFENLHGLVLGVDNNIEQCGIYNCSNCNKEVEKSITAKELGMPIINFEGDIKDVSKENEVMISVKYDNGNDINFESYATIKVQGATSAAYPKKNYNIKFYKDSNGDKKDKIDLGWGKENKYCLKANYIDPSHARNVVSGKIYNEILKTQEGLDENLMQAPNGGVVDGYPVVVYHNGAFLGLYTLNIAKDKWMFGMDMEDGDKKAALMADDHEHTDLRKPIDEDFTGWEVEECSTDDVSWVRESFNNFIEFLNTSDDQLFKEKINEYVDINCAIDSMLITLLAQAEDNTGKNIMWLTYDGVKWIPSIYDMDGTWGGKWNGNMGQAYLPIDPTGEYLWYNELWSRLIKLFGEKIKERYFELRESVLTEEKLVSHFNSFFDMLPEFVYETEKNRWGEGFLFDYNAHKKNIFEFIKNRLIYMDEQLALFGNL